MARQQSGSIGTAAFRDGDTARIAFSGPLIDAGIMLFLDRGQEGMPCPVVAEVDETGFTLRIEDWHPDIAKKNRMISWIAMEPGTQALSHGCMVDTRAGASRDADPPTLGRKAKPSLEPLPPPPTVVSDSLAEYAEQYAREQQSELTLDADFYDSIRRAAADATAHAEAVPAKGEFPEAVGFQAVDFSGDTLGQHVITSQHVVPGLEQDDGERHIGDWLSDFFVSHQALGNAAVMYEADALGGIGGSACYTPGTLITTLQGQVDTADLAVGDPVLTRDHGFQVLRDILRSRLSPYQVALDPDIAPILIKADALGPGRPAADMQVAPNHRLLLTGLHAELLAGEEEVFISARSLIDDMHVVQMQPSEVTYLMFLFDVPQVIYANGAASESLGMEMLARGRVTPEARTDLRRIFSELPLPAGPIAHAI